MAAGTISFFGTRRVVVLPEMTPQPTAAKDLDEMCTRFERSSTIWS